MIRYNTTDLSGESTVVLKINDMVFDLTQVNLAFGLNEIPIAQCQLAIGNETKNKNEQTIKNQNELVKLKKSTPATILFHPKGNSTANIPWPNQPEVIFEGKISNISRHKMAGKIVTTVGLSHWLSDLKASSVLNATSHPSNPGVLSTAAFFATTGGTFTPANAYTNLGTLVKFLSSTQISQDLWSAFKDIFCYIADQKVAPISTLCGTPTDKIYNNPKVLAAFQKIEGGIEYPRTEGEPYVNYSRPLSLAKIDTTIANSIATAICSELISGYAQSDFWERLIGLILPSFGMALVPMVKRALVIAETPAYKKNVWRTIYPWEYESLEQIQSLNTPLRGVGVAPNFTLNTWVAQKQIAGTGLLGGCFINDVEVAEENDGNFLVVNAPPWLNNISYATTNPLRASHLLKNDATPVAGADIQKQKEQAVKDKQISEFFNNYARNVYFNNQLKGQQAILNGRLRFDIAPGSLVRLNQTHTVFGENNVPGLLDYIGYVVKVSINLNAEQASASTNFMLDYVRTEEENKKDIFGVSEHPIFGGAIHGNGLHGAPLIPAYDFVEDLLNEVE